MKRIVLRMQGNGWLERQPYGSLLAILLLVAVRCHFFVFFAGAVRDFDNKEFALLIVERIFRATSETS